MWQAQGKRAAIVAAAMLPNISLPPGAVEEYIESGYLGDDSPSDVLPYSPAVMEALHNGNSERS